MQAFYPSDKHTARGFKEDKTIAITIARSIKYLYCMRHNTNDFINAIFQNFNVIL